MVKFYHSSWFVVVLWFLAMPPAAQAEPLRLRLCGIDQANPPYYLVAGGQANAVAPGAGIAVDLVDSLRKHLGLIIEVHRVPWKRCMLSLANGLFDGALGTSYLAEREAFARYPQAATSSPDAARAMYISHYWLYVDQAAVHWDGEHLELPQGAQIGTGLGYSIGMALRKRGVAVQEAYSQQDLIDWLQRGGLTAVAGYATELEPVIRSNKKFAGIHRLSVPLSQDAMYLVFNKAFYDKHPDVAESVWNLLGQLHRNGDYARIAAQYIQDPQP